MRGGQQLNVRTDLDVVANRHCRHIQRDQTQFRKQRAPIEV